MVASRIQYRWLARPNSVGAQLRGWILLLATGAVVGGAFGNAFDRVMYGAVVDYLNMSCCGINNPYSFNVADVLIFCGAVFIVIGHETKMIYGK
jgi:lipoprotein signal peptidase